MKYYISFVVCIVVSACSDEPTPMPITVDCSKMSQAEGSSVTIDCGDTDSDNVTTIGSTPINDGDAGPVNGAPKITVGIQCPVGGKCPEMECILSQCINGKCHNVALFDGQECLFSEGVCQGLVCVPGN